MGFKLSKISVFTKNFTICKKSDKHKRYKLRYTEAFLPHGENRFITPEKINWKSATPGSFRVHCCSLHLQPY